MEIFKNKVYQQQAAPAKTTMSGISETEIGPPPEYGGSHRTLNPEEMFVAAINSCIMLVFNHFAEKFEIDILSYSSEAQGKVEKTRNGLRFTGVQVKAEVRINDTGQAGKIQEIARLAEKYCLVSGSVACPVEYNVEVID